MAALMGLVFPWPSFVMPWKHHQKRCLVDNLRFLEWSDFHYQSGYENPPKSRASPFPPWRSSPCLACFIVPVDRMWKPESSFGKDSVPTDGKGAGVRR